MFISFPQAIYAAMTGNQADIMIAFQVQDETVKIREKIN